MKHYFTIGELISKLNEFKNEFGDLPIMISCESEDEFLKPMQAIFTAAIHNDDEIQHNTLILSNYEIEDIDDYNISSISELEV